ncbi:MAG: biotin/lipoyl-binding protein, partial [Thiohalospira sp.]
MTPRSTVRWSFLGLLLALLAGGAVYLLLRPVAVPVVAAEAGELRPDLEVPGTVEARLEYTVGARVASEVEAVHVDQRDRVAPDQPLVELDDRELRAAVRQAEQALAAAREQAEAARSALDQARAELDRARRDHRRNRESDEYVSARELDASETALRAARAARESARADLKGRKAEVARAEAALEEARTRLGHARVTARGRALVIER